MGAEVDTKSKVLRLEAQAQPLTVLLDDNELQSIVAYTHDLGKAGGIKDGNFYYEENKDLRKRELALRMQAVKTWGVHVYYALRGLGKLSDFKGTVYRGFPDKATATQEYLLGRP